MTRSKNIKHNYVGDLLIRIYSVFKNNTTVLIKWMERKGHNGGRVDASRVFNVYYFCYKNNVSVLLQNVSPMTQCAHRRRPQPPPSLSDYTINYADERARG